MLAGVVTLREPKMLRGSSCSGYGGQWFAPSWSYHTAGVESGPNLQFLGHCAKATLVFLHAPRFSQQNASRNRALMYIQTTTSRMQYSMTTPPLTCAPGRADRVNLPRVLSPHEEDTVRCAKARPGSNSSSGSQRQ